MVSRDSHAVPLHHRITASVNGPKATSRVPGYLPPHSFYVRFTSQSLSGPKSPRQVSLLDWNGICAHL